MITGPKYKIARRLGAPIFDKTQSQKFKASADKRKKGRMRPPTNFGIQLIEKQKARFTYGVSEKQFSKYAKNIINKKTPNPQEKLFEELEARLDNVIYRIGLGNTRGFTRQIVSHGHIRINGKKMNIPSYKVKKGDEISIRDGSLKRPLFQNVNEKIKERTLPIWIVRGGVGSKKSDAKDLKWGITDLPKYQPLDLLFDLNTVIQFYKK